MTGAANARNRIDESQILPLASRYSYPSGDEVPDEIGARARRNGSLSKPDFLALCRWKTPRSASKCASNSEAFVLEATRIAFSSPVEEMRVGALTLLRGVSWPTASTILHFCHRDPYPLLDYRAIWSIGMAQPAQYTFAFWWSYVERCRAMANRNGVCMRTLDRALWQFSKENQPAT